MRPDPTARPGGSPELRLAGRSALDRVFGQQAERLRSELLSEGNHFVTMATMQAARAEAIAVALAGGGWFASEADPALAALPEGTSALITTQQGAIHTVRIIDGVPVRSSTLPTGGTDTANGINLWEFAKGDGMTDDTVAVNRALALAVSLGVRRINCGGPDRTYLLGGPFVVYGTFPTPEGTQVPFSRYKIRLHSDLEIVGDGARFKLSGRATYPGGIFGHPFWNGERLRNVAIKGLVLDGSADEQIVPPIPGGTHDNSVWQHGTAISGCYDGLEVSGCVIHDFRGHGINIVWASHTAPEPWARPQHVDIHHNEFFNIFTQASNAAAFDTRFHHNKIHGNGFWVAGLDIEAGDTRFPMRTVRSYRNVYDFRDGLSPPESAPQHASDSAQAYAGRRHTRRAVSAFCPPTADNVWPGTMDDIIIEDETIYQGLIVTSRFGNVKIRNPRITNTIAEDLTGYFSGSANAISITAENEKGIADCEVTGAVITSVLAGQGIYAHGIERLAIRDSRLRGMGSAAVRIEACSGNVENIEAIDFGGDERGYSLDAIGANSSAVTIYGGQTGRLRIANVHASDTRAGTARRALHAVYANVAASPPTRIDDCRGTNLRAETIRDVNATALKAGSASAGGAIAATMEPSRPAKGGA